jgi:hypothetical protein
MTGSKFGPLIIRTTPVVSSSAWPDTSTNLGLRTVSSRLPIAVLATCTAAHHGAQRLSSRIAKLRLDVESARPGAICPRGAVSASAVLGLRCPLLSVRVRQVSGNAAKQRRVGSAVSVVQGSLLVRGSRQVDPTLTRHNVGESPHRASSTCENPMTRATGESRRPADYAAHFAAKSAAKLQTSLGWHGALRGTRPQNLNSRTSLAHAGTLQSSR